MKKKINEVLKIFPGLIFALVIAFVAQWIEKQLPIHLIGASVIALFIGMVINIIILMFRKIRNRRYEK